MFFNAHNTSLLYRSLFHSSRLIIVFLFLYMYLFPANFAQAFITLCCVVYALKIRKLEAEASSKQSTISKLEAKLSKAATSTETPQVCYLHSLEK